MTIYFCDIEANGFLDSVTKIHCLSYRIDDNNYGTIAGSHVHEFFDRDIVDGDTLVWHNGFGYDLPVLIKLGIISGYNIDDNTITLMDGTVKQVQLIDSLAMSREYWPDMPLPQGCPATVYNPVTKQHDKIGAHSLMAWAYRLGSKKPVIHDWNNLPIEDYIERCEEDVITTEKLFLHLCDKLGVEL